MCLNFLLCPHMCTLLSRLRPVQFKRENICTFWACSALFVVFVKKRVLWMKKSISISIRKHIGPTHLNFNINWSERLRNSYKTWKMMEIISSFDKINLLEFWLVVGSLASEFLGWSWKTHNSPFPSLGIPRLELENPCWNSNSLGTSWDAKNI